MARDELYPLLVNTSKSIEDAKVFCQAVIMAIKQGFNRRLTTTHVKDLELIAMLDQTTEQYDKYKKVLEMFQDETLQDAINLIEGMGYAIEGFQKEESSKRPLGDLKATFLD